MNLAKRFAALILESRTRRNLTQGEVAERAGISLRWYQKIESGARLPSTAVALRLIFTLDIELETLKKECDI